MPRISGSAGVGGTPGPSRPPTEPSQPAGPAGAPPSTPAGSIGARLHFTPLSNRPPDRALQAEIVKRMRELQERGVDQPELAQARRDLFRLTLADKDLRSNIETSLDDGDYRSGDRHELIHDREKRIFREAKKDAGLDERSAQEVLLEHVGGLLTEVAASLSAMQRGPTQAMLSPLRRTFLGRLTLPSTSEELYSALSNFRHGYAKILSQDLHIEALRDAAGRFATALPALDPAQVTECLIADRENVQASLRHEVDVVGYAAKISRPGRFAFEPRMDGSSRATNSHTFRDATRYLMHERMNVLIKLGEVSPAVIAREASSIVDACRSKGLAIPIGPKDLELAGLSALLRAGRLGADLAQSYSPEDLRKALGEAVRREIFLNINGSRYDGDDETRTAKFAGFIARTIDALPTEIQTSVYGSLSVPAGQDRRERLKDDLLTHARETWYRLQNPANSDDMV